MKLVLCQPDEGGQQAGLVTEGGVVPIPDLHDLGQLIAEFDARRAELEQLARIGQARTVTLLAPLPRPGKILCSNTGQGSLLLTLKSPESVIGPGQTVQLPVVDGGWEFVPRAELGLVIRGPAKDIKADQWQHAVFGYTCVIDVLARGGDPTFGRDLWLAKADTLGPLGPCLVTRDEIDEVEALRVRSWHNGQARQDFRLQDAPYTLGQHVELATTVMTLNTGDVLACGSSPDGLDPLRDGDTVDVEIDGIGRLTVGVST